MSRAARDEPDRTAARCVEADVRRRNDGDRNRDERERKTEDEGDVGVRVESDGPDREQRDRQKHRPADGPAALDAHLVDRQRQGERQRGGREEHRERTSLRLSTPAADADHEGCHDEDDGQKPCSGLLTRRNEAMNSRAAA